MLERRERERETGRERERAETGSFESRPSCPLCRMIDGRSPPSSPLFSFSPPPPFFFYSMPALLFCSFFLVSSPLLELRRLVIHDERKRLVHFSTAWLAAAGNTRNPPPDGNGAPLDRDKGTIKARDIAAAVARRVDLSLFCFSLQAGSARSIEIPDREECYRTARVRRKSKPDAAADGVITGSVFLMMSRSLSLSLFSRWRGRRTVCRMR